MSAIGYPAMRSDLVRPEANSHLLTLAALVNYWSINRAITNTGGSTWVLRGVSWQHATNTEFRHLDGSYASSLSFTSVLLGLIPSTVGCRTGSWTASARASSALSQNRPTTPVQRQQNGCRNNEGVSGDDR